MPTNGMTIDSLNTVSSLTAQDAHNVATTLAALPAQQPLEERHAAVGDACLAQQRLTDEGVGLALLHHGGQLLVVANEDEAVGLHEQSHQLGLEDLRRLVDNHQLEVLQTEQVGTGLQHRCGAHDDVVLLQGRGGGRGLCVE